jgi:nicotinate dehydrogenase subunit A
MGQLTVTVNDRTRTLDVDPSTPLLYVLRNDLELNAPKFGCGLSQCGACTVVMNGRAIRSCVTPVSAAEGQEVTTLEGLGTADRPGRLQQAFIDEQAAQCGYCINGMVMTTHALLQSNPTPTEAEIREALDGNLCRCGTHVRILRAIRRAVGQAVS